VRKISENIAFSFQKCQQGRLVTFPERPCLGVIKPRTEVFRSAGVGFYERSFFAAASAASCSVQCRLSQGRTLLPSFAPTWCQAVRVDTPVSSAIRKYVTPQARSACRSATFPTSGLQEVHWHRLCVLFFVSTTPCGSVGVQSISAQAVQATHCLPVSLDDRILFIFFRGAYPFRGHPASAKKTRETAETISAAV